METSTTLRVRAYECDGYRHVNNAVYLHYLETGRYEYLRDIGFDYKAMLASGYGVYVSRVEIRYLSPAREDDELLIRTRPIKTRVASGVIEQVISRGNDTIARASVTWAFVDSTGKPTRIPEQFRVPGLFPETN
jgi:acyl-CoA thioester hydrolase